MNSKLRVITFILVLLPVLSFFSQRFFAVQSNQLELFSTHIMVNYADWLFIPFNLFVLFATALTRRNLLIFLGIGLVLNIGIHYYWGTLSEQGLIQSHLFVNGVSEMTNGGIVHLLFSWIQTSLIGLFFFFTKNNKYVIYCLISLLFYVFTLFYGSYVFHNGKPLITDIGLGLGLIMAIAFTFYRYRFSSKSD